MAVQYTEEQKKVIRERGKNLLVSAAAGSGKTAVLVERIISLITEKQPDGGKPVDIDRILVLTFTRAAAAQMRDKISVAVSKRLAEEPDNAHLERQETLIHNAQITTIDSFCTFLLRNNFSAIGLDPGFRQADEMEAELLRQDSMDAFLEEQYAAKDPAFYRCVEYFCPDKNDDALGKLITRLYRMAMSHPFPEEWLAEHGEDYAVKDTEDLFTKLWFTGLMESIADSIRDMLKQYDGMLEICSLTGDRNGPASYLLTLTAEREALEALLPATDDTAETAYRKLSGLNDLAFERLKAPGKKDDVDPALQDQVKGQRDALKKQIRTIADRYFGTPLETTVRRMQEADGALRELGKLTEGFIEAYAAAKKEKNLIDFDDLEHFALQILGTRGEDGQVSPTATALAYREHFAEVMCDEYQDSNEVQELLLELVSGGKPDAAGNPTLHNRFCVGDVKQSIYKFRLAKPEIFMDKFHTFRADDPVNERIDLDKNFRSRAEVLDCTNFIFDRIMRREIGGIEYDAAAALKNGNLSYPSYPDCRPELIVTELSEQTPDPQEDGEDDDTETGVPETTADLTAHGKEALVIADRIRKLVGTYRVTDSATGELRPARYGDIVILLRNAKSNAKMREVLERQGIPVYIAAKGGYFGAEEIREVLNFLRVLDNPRQDIPLYGVLHGFFGGFSEDEIAAVRLAERADADAGAPHSADTAEAAEVAEAAAASEDQPQVSEAGAESEPENTPENGAALYTALLKWDILQDPVLRDKCSRFLALLGHFRKLRETSSIHELLTAIFDETGYEDYVAALPAGAQRSANLALFLDIAQNFESTSYTGLFNFLRYIDQMKVRELDLGEASAIDENADVVRIMTIHKSKGLEFPIVIVANLTGGFNSSDEKGTLIVENEAGIGLDYVDPVLRTRTTTLRKEAVADRIRRDSRGEELRVLYVAMTRAKEKLILSAAVKDYATTYGKRRKRIGPVQGKLPVSEIASCNSYADLIFSALAAGENNGITAPLSVTFVSPDDLTLSSVEEQAGMAVRQGVLRKAEEAASAGNDALLPDPVLAKTLRNVYSYRYPHAELKDLYTKTTVTELKKAAMHAFDEEGIEEERQQGRRLYPVNVPGEHVVPSFAAEGTGIGDHGGDVGIAASGSVSVPEADGSLGRAASAGQNAGAARGSVIHRCMEIFDYQRFPDPGAVDAAAFEEWKQEMIQTGRIDAAEARVLTADVILPFLHSPLAARMAAADCRGRLFREQPFVLGLPADRIDPAFPASETLLVQGIIDAMFEENGSWVIVDYKTDRVKTASELIDRYKVQLDYYAEAVSRIYDMPVTEEVIYSFELQESIPLK